MFMGPEIVMFAIPFVLYPKIAIRNPKVIQNNK